MNFSFDIDEVLKQGKALVKDTKELVIQSKDRLLDKEIKLGITGFSRSGKTALITALTNNICHFYDEDIADKLVRFSAFRKYEVISGATVDLKDVTQSVFPYIKARDSIINVNPVWPVPTDGVSKLRLEIMYKNKESSWYKSDSIKRLYLEIIDYPGEWLMDLMLLNCSFEKFSELVSRRITKIGGVVDCANFVALGQSLKPNLSVKKQEKSLKETVTAYTKWLRMCKEKGFTLNVPGHFILPGDEKDSAVLEFIPWIWDRENSDKELNKDSLYEVLKKRYEDYKEHIVKKFYHECFEKLDRQVILIDCLNALKGGKETFDDVNDSFEALLNHFNYGKSNLFTRLFSSKIDKVMFAATKADTITNDQHENLKCLLNSMIKKNSPNIKGNDSDYDTMVLSAIRATSCEKYGQNDECLRILDGNDERYYPGSVPTKWSLEEMEFFQKNFCFKELNPPKIEEGSVIPSMNLDVLLDYIIGDKL